MNKFALFLLLSLSSIIYSCSSAPEPTENQNSENSKLMRSSGEADKEVDAASSQKMEEYYFYISRKWELGDDFIDIKGDGLFEAKLEGKAVVGKWGMSSSTDDNQVLRLIGIGDNVDFSKTYEIITISLERLVAIDKEGNKINFLAAQ